MSEQNVQCVKVFFKVLMHGSLLVYCVCVCVGRVGDLSVKNKGNASVTCTKNEEVKGIKYDKHCIK